MKPTSKRGRKRGSKTTYTVAGDPIEENLARAIWGELSDKPATGWIHTIWAQCFPSTLVRESFASISREEAERLMSERALDFGRLFGEEVARRIKARDAKFFADAAKAVQRLMDLDVPGDASRAALLAHVAVVRQGLPQHRFTQTELLDGVEWPKGGRPSERQLARLTKDLGIPMRRGRPKQ